MKDFEPPNELRNANGQPFDYNGITYSPKFKNGEITAYEGRVKNLRIYIYPNKVYLCNSIHKYWHGNNHGDFTLSDNKEAVRSLHERTGISWSDAIVMKCEFGFNLQENASSIIDSLISYKGNDYYPMQKNGRKYGTVCELTEYKIKGYDKALETKLVTGYSLAYPIFRWEIAYKRTRSIERYLGLDHVRLRDLLEVQNWELMSRDASTKYLNSIKKQCLSLYGLSPHEQRVLAVWDNPRIRENLRNHHAETYKRDKRIYRHLVKNKKVFREDEVGKQITAKSFDLMADMDYLKSPHSRLVV